MNHFRLTIRAFVAAVLAIALMVILRRFVLVPIFEFRPPFLPLLSAVALAAWIGGARSGLFATALGAGILYFRFGRAPDFDFIPTRFFLTRLAVFLVCGGLINW